jgi:DNA polymerase/3'-5' exonuclease PolX
MTNREIAAILFNISSLLAAQDGNPYRIRAYRRAARNLLRARHSVAERARNGQSLGIPLLGKRLTQTISKLALDGSCDVYEELVGELPSAQQRLLHVPGIGPKLAERIAKDLKAEDAETLIRQAASVGLQRVWGIGPKRARLIVDELQSTAAPSADTPFVRDGNVIYVQESFWNAERKQAA